MHAQGIHQVRRDIRRARGARDRRLGHRNGCAEQAAEAGEAGCGRKGARQEGISTKKTSAKDSGEKPESGATEADTDGAAQAAACAAAGVTGDNVNYDDATGKCSLDTGADSNQ